MPLPGTTFGARTFLTNKLTSSSAAAVRIPAVMQHPSFRANPWATIREHAGNTLAAAESVKDMEERARQKRTPKANITVGGVKSDGGMEGIE